jgi:hypothetical protein
VSLVSLFSCKRPWATGFIVPRRAAGQPRIRMNHASASGNRSLHQAFRVIIVLVTLCIAEAFLLEWRWRRNPSNPWRRFPTW